MKIANEAMIAAYVIAKRIRERRISMSAGIEELHRRFGLDPSSASHTIKNIGHMLEGEVYKRTNNDFATEHFLKMIHRDYGLGTLKRAVSAVDQHLSYYESLGKGKRRSLAVILAKWRQIANGLQEREDMGGRESGALLMDLDEIAKQKSIDSTTRETLVAARLGQGDFRTQVFRLWDNRCAVTGSVTDRAIRASHIKPWRDSSNAERLDPHNGLPLIASIDALFDTGLISFESSGRLIASSSMNAIERRIFGIDRATLRKQPSPKTVEYLAQHRAKHGFGA